VSRRIVLDLDEDDDDDEVEIVGQAGANPLADFPHPRHACVVCPFPERRACVSL